jgi:hypothetical protein
MRDRVKLKVGGEELELLPAYEVIDAFEDRYYGLPEHLERLIDGKATIQQRAYLILLGANAADPGAGFKQEAIQTGMFQVGYWHEDMVNREAEFIERLLYTPEQYLAKKSERENVAKDAMDAIVSGFSNDASESQP